VKILQSLPKTISKINIRNGFDWLATASRLPMRGITALRYSFHHSNNENKQIFSEEKTENIIAKEPSSKHISFTFAAISLSALVARADGTVSRAEYLVFRDSFPLTGGMCGKLRQLFLLACQSKTPPTTHVQQIKQLFPQQIDLFISLVDRLFRIATADKPLSREEERILARISHSLGLSPSEYSALYDCHSRPLAPHAVLGVKKRSPRNIIKQRYHALMNRYHPDRYSAMQTSPEIQMLLTLRTSEISQAYHKLTRKAA
jgi:DnaJ like chaperone protein